MARSGNARPGADRRAREGDQETAADPALAVLCPCDGGGGGGAAARRGDAASPAPAPARVHDPHQDSSRRFAGDRRCRASERPGAAGACDPSGVGGARVRRVCERAGRRPVDRARAARDAEHGGTRRSRYRWIFGPCWLPPETDGAQRGGGNGGRGGAAARRSSRGGWALVLALAALSCAPGADASLRTAMFTRARASQSSGSAGETSQELVLATWNPQKLRELAEVTRILHVKTFSAEQAGLKPPSVMHATAEEDSEAKASAVARASNRPALADCAVLQVPALKNAPGLTAASIVQEAGGWEVCEGAGAGVGAGVACMRESCACMHTCMQRWSAHLCTCAHAHRRIHGGPGAPGRRAGAGRRTGLH